MKLNFAGNILKNFFLNIFLNYLAEYNRSDLQLHLGFRQQSSYGGHAISTPPSQKRNDQNNDKRHSRQGTHRLLFRNQTTVNND